MLPLGRHVVETGPEGPARIVDKHVDGTEFVVDTLQEGGHGVVVAGVKHVRHAAAPHRLHLLNHIGQECGILVEHGHIRTEAGQGQRGGRAYPAGRAGHHRDPVG